MEKEFIPLEDQESINLAYWLDLNNYKYTHTPNESWMASSWWAQKIMAKKKRMWVKKGFPDFTVFLKTWWTLYLEMKRQKNSKWKSPSVSSHEQIEWIDFLKTVENSDAYFVYWCDEAINLILEFEK